MGLNWESKGQIGYEGARRIIENGGPEREAYLKRFQEENPLLKQTTQQMETTLQMTYQGVSDLKVEPFLLKEEKYNAPQKVEQ